LTAREVPIHIVDAFTSEPFAGNPAAVCLLEGARSDRWLQAVAAEMNLSETAFLWREGPGYRLRWFTPALEVPLCGHATLASAHLLFESGRTEGDELRFATQSGELRAVRQADGIELDFPAFRYEPALLPVAVASEREVRGARPDARALLAAGAPSVILTTRSETPGFDFVSRYFAPGAGIDEDPVTGAAHCALAPYWAKKLGKAELVGFQASKRGGVVGVRALGERVALRGQAVTVVSGRLLR